jgi:hypothetical protein
MRAEQHRPAADRREVVLGLVIDDRRLVGQQLLEQPAQIGVPLASPSW